MLFVVAALALLPRPAAAETNSILFSDLKSRLLNQSADKATLMLGLPDRDYAVDVKPGGASTRHLRYYWYSECFRQKQATVLDYDYSEKTMYKCRYLRITVVNGRICAIAGEFEEW